MGADVNNYYQGYSTFVDTTLFGNITLMPYAPIISGNRLSIFGDIGSFNLPNNGGQIGVTNGTGSGLFAHIGNLVMAARATSSDGYGNIGFYTGTSTTLRTEITAGVGTLKHYYGAIFDNLNLTADPTLKLISNAGSAPILTGYDGTSLKFTLANNGNVTTVGTLTATGGNSTNWNTAYSWGNHASAGYLTGLSAGTWAVVAMQEIRAAMRNNFFIIYVFKVQ